MGLGCIGTLSRGLRGRNIRLNYPRRERLYFRHFRLDLRGYRRDLHLHPIDGLRSVAEYGVQIASASGLRSKMISLSFRVLGFTLYRFGIFCINDPWSRAGIDRWSGLMSTHLGIWCGLSYRRIHSSGKNRALG